MLGERKENRLLFKLKISDWICLYFDAQHPESTKCNNASEDGENNFLLVQVDVDDFFNKPIEYLVRSDTRSLLLSRYTSASSGDAIKSFHFPASVIESSSLPFALLTGQIPASQTS